MLLALQNKRAFIAFVHDCFIAIFSFGLAISLRYGIINPFSAPIVSLDLLYLIVVLSQITSFLLNGLYRGVWRYSSTPDLLRVVRASTMGVLLSIMVVFIWNRLESAPRSVFIIDWFLLIMGLGGGRLFYRLWKDGNLASGLLPTKKTPAKPVLIIGAGSAGEQLCREILYNKSIGLNVVGFIDDDPQRLNRTIHGIRVLGMTPDIPNIVQRLQIEKIFIALPSATGEQMKTIISLCEDSRIEFKTLPKINDILDGKVELSLLRNVGLEDLLGRDPIKLDLGPMEKMLSNKSVMVTGAGGSIGKELCKQIAFFKPEKLILFEQCELFLYELEMELKESFPEVEFIPFIGNVRDRSRVALAFSRYNPQIVLHAAAYKHVPMMESNPIEAIQTNVVGTKIVTELSGLNKIEKFVMISTDKAVNPTNIMGATKRVAEMVCLWASEKFNHTQFLTVRFGNVLGSNGSVVPLFKKQIEKGGPITITDPDITRYFMSIPEACQLVLQAATMGRGREIFVLDMGKPVKIIELAREMLRLAGLREKEDIEIKITGLRPGEKLYEELFSSKEPLSETSHRKVMIAQSRVLPGNFDQNLNSLITLNISFCFEEVVETMKALVPEFTPTHILQSQKGMGEELQ